MAPYLPAELWLQIFGNLSISDDAASSQTEIWANVIKRKGNREDIEEGRRAIDEYGSMLCTLSLVSRRFYELSRPLALEFIIVRSGTNLRHLASKIRDDPQTANLMDQWTKRIDLYFDLPPWTGASKGLYVDLELVVRSCPKLGAFCYSSRPEVYSPSKDVMNVLLDITPHLEILRWQHVDLPATTLSSALQKFNELRVLDLKDMFVGQLKGMGKCDLPYLHTLVGSFRTLCPTFKFAQLPSLRTLICPQPAAIGFVDFQDYMAFLKGHGEKIRSFDGPTEGDLDFQLCCPNIEELVIEDFDPARIVAPMVNVKRIGISTKIRDNGQARMNFLHMLRILAWAIQEGKLPKLHSVCILRKQTVQTLRKHSAISLRLPERELRGYSVRLEDNSGDLLVPPSS